ncbi:MAG: DUF1257 domain-containing protein [Cyanobacteria bacterium]|nr:DUF1257 domain-containing protein [Cyanobacteriota bacterium]MDW8200208.1 DUF1257 domain-containing protein [Cyanobacteriota bacterium SKYGB_h_bin112]
MSHFSQIKTKLRDLTCLQAALSDLGIQWSSSSGTVRGYQGQTCQAELTIPQQNGHDIGFRWTGSEYELVADLQFWQQAWSVDRFLSKVTQRYAYHTIVTETAQQGFQIAEQTNQQDGSVRLVLQRWSA